jgi:hypothetical protein
MSEEQTNKNNLEELLARFKNEQSNSDLDPFEQEALEGFEQMESKEAVRDFVGTTQARVHKRLRIQHQEKRSPKTYWMMAASIVLFAGLSVVFYSMLQETEQTRHVVIQEPKVEEQKKIESMPPQGTAATIETFTSTNGNTVVYFNKVETEGKKEWRVADKSNTGAKQAETLAEEDNTYKTITSTAANASPVTVASGQVFKLEESVVQNDSIVVLNNNATNAAPATNVNSSSWIGGIVATETKKAEKEAAPKSVGYSIKRAEASESKSNARADDGKVSTTLASTSVETKAYYTEGNGVLTTKLKAQFLKNEVLKTITQKLEIEISLTETNEIKTVAIPNLKEENLKVELIKELKQLTGYRTAQKNGRNIPSVFVFTFQP